MANPFPGMNPFLEDPAFWSDFHATFIVCWRDSIRSVLPRTYEARIGERVIMDETREAYIEILQRPEMALVAVLELLSPWNKTEPGFGEYLAKRNALFRQDVHVIELDLLLGGRRLPLGKSLPEGDYFALISRGDRRPDCNVYHWGLRDKLPIIPLPLRAPDSDAATNLAEVFSVAFERGFYNQSPDFGRRLPVSLPPSDAAWVREVMSSR